MKRIGNTIKGKIKYLIPNGYFNTVLMCVIGVGNKIDPIPFHTYTLATLATLV